MSKRNANIEDTDLRAIALRKLKAHRRAFPDPMRRGLWHAGWREGLYDTLIVVQAERDAARIRHRNRRAWQRPHTRRKK